ncbi:MAG: protein-tyrosine phosphatase family protein [Candidatus Thorarchaeota archaeon]|jgi:atypical dual specificity phosphatase
MFEHRSGELWGSSLPETNSDLQKIADAGIKVVVSLESRFGYPDFSEYGLEHHQISIPDFDIPSEQNVREFVDIVKTALNQGKSVLVHCLAGCGRTGTMLAIAEVYLYGETKGHNAIDTVRKTRSCAIETSGQEESIKAHAANPLQGLT